MAGEMFQADMSKLLLRQKFASGGDSKIYRGSYDGEEVAVKIIQVPEQQLDDDFDLDEVEEKMKQAERLKKMFKNEVSFLSRLNHSNIVKFVAAYESYPVYGVFTEFMPGGCLRSYLNHLEKRPLPLTEIVPMALDISRGMEYLHSQGIVHRDLKPENVLIDQDFRLKIADFGISCEEAKCEKLKNGIGTYRWMAPEVFRGKSYNRKADVYSFGLMMWELVSGEMPFKHMAPIQAAFAAANNHARPAIPDDIPPAIGELIRLCWSEHIKKRPEFRQIVVALEQLRDRLTFGQNIGILEDHLNNKHKGLQHWFKSHKPRFGLLSIG